MSGGPMRIRLSLGIMLALIAGPAAAETADCAALVAVVEAATGLGLTAPASGMEDGWCVLDSARSSGEGSVRVTIERLRLRGEVAGEELVALEILSAGLRVSPSLSVRDMPDWLRDFLRLQTAEVDLMLRRDEAGDQLLLERGRLGLSGGSELVVTGEVAGAGISAASLLTGRVTKLSVEWKNDGRTLRPVMEAMGAQLEPGATGTKAVLAARSALAGLVEAVPESSLPEDSADALSAFIAALPQGPGRLMLILHSDSGIGMAQMGLLALSDDRRGPEALARLFADVAVGANWAPGIAP
jgi:hypothetical protein